MTRFQPAGRRNKTIVLQRLINDRNQFGEPEQVWYSVATLRAEVGMTSAGEAVRAGQPVMTDTHVFTMPVFDVRSSDRILFGGTVYEISGVIRADSRDRFIRVEAHVSANATIDDADVLTDGESIITT